MTTGAGSGTQATQGQEPTNAAPAGQQSGEQQPEDGGQGPGEGQQGNLSVQEALSEMRRARAEAANFRTQLRQAQQSLTEAQNAQLSEADKLRNQVQTLTDQNSRLEAQMQATALRSVIRATAGSLGFRNPDLAAGLIDSGQVEFDDNGRAKNVERLLKDLLKENPYLGSGGGGDGGQGQQAGKGTNMNSLIRQAAGYES